MNNRPNCDPCKPFNRIKYCGNGVQGTNIQDGDDFQTILDKLANSSGGGAVPPTRRVDTGTGLTGGGDLQNDLTIELDPTSVNNLQLASTAVQPATLNNYVPTSRNITAGTGLTGGGALSSNQTISLNSASVASLALADTSVQPSRSITAGTGLTGGGNLSTNRTISLSTATINSLALADSALQPSDIFKVVTKTQLDTLISNNDLIPNALYNITDADTQYLYGGTSIFLRAITTNELEEYGMGMFYNPKYDQTIAGFGVAKDYAWWAQPADQLPSGAYSVGDNVIWGGYHWECIQATTTSTKYILDDFELDTAYFTKIPFNNSDYNVVYDTIRYDYANDMIIVRDNGNIKVEFDYNWLYYFSNGNMNANLHYNNPIRNMQWGNDFDYNNSTGILDVNIYKGIHRYINFQSFSLTRITCLENSKQNNLTFSIYGTQNNITFYENSGQNSIIFYENSGQNSIIFSQNSYQNSIIFSQNSYQNSIVFNQNSGQDNVILDQGSDQSNLKFNQNSKINWNSQPISSDIENTTFNNGFYNINDINDYPFLVDSRYKEIYCDSNGQPYLSSGQEINLTNTTGNIPFDAEMTIIKYNGLADGTYDLADGVDADTGKRIFIINKSGFDLTINGNIYDYGSTGSKTIGSGLQTTIIWDNSDWCTIQ